MAKGFVHSILTLMGIFLPCPDHTTLTRLNATVKISRLDHRELRRWVDLIVDSTRLKVCDEHLGTSTWRATQDDVLSHIHNMVEMLEHLKSNFILFIIHF